MSEEFKKVMATEQNGFYLEIEDLESMVGESPEWLRYRGIDWGAGNQQCNVIFHASNGGLMVDEQGQSRIPGLYALGESATGPHGTDRPGGHMMGACQVFGMLAGRHAAMRAGETLEGEADESLAEKGLNRIASLKAGKGELSPAGVKRRLQEVTYENMLVIRSKESLTTVLKEIQIMRDDFYPRLRIEKPADLIEALELENLLTVGELVASCALMREETRGSHFRADYPERDDSNWLGVITVRKGDKGPMLERLIVDPEWTDRPGDMGEDPWG
jgi:succinate dehydrogenase/fumarate reductase flavoprotein subunit